MEGQRWSSILVRPTIKIIPNETATTLVKGSESCAKNSIQRVEKEDIEKEGIGEY